MQNLKTGRFEFMKPVEAGIIERIFRAGRRTLPIFTVGEVLEVKSGRFEVLALDGALMILRGIPRDSESPRGIPCSTGREVEVDENGEVAISDWSK